MGELLLMRKNGFRLGLVAILATGVAPAQRTPESVPSDFVSKYYIVVNDSRLSPELVIERFGPDGTYYFQFNIDCLNRKARRGPEQDSIAGTRNAGYGSFVNLIDGTVEADLARGPCQEPGRARFARYVRETDRSARQRQRVFEVRPRRRDSQPRVANLTDAEVLEIERVVEDIAPGDTVNIGTVVFGCPCEDGPTCTDQVWVVSYRPESSTGLLLSRIAGQWTVGPVQSWWREYETLLSKPRHLVWDEETELYKRFPKCASDEIVERAGDE